MENVASVLVDIICDVASVSDVTILLFVFLMEIYRKGGMIERASKKHFVKDLIHV